MSQQSEAVKRWRISTKKRMVAAMGGKCAICSYDRCADALDFHHLDPNEKDFSFGAIRGSPRSWVQIVNELRKCVLLCCLCHREVHAGIAHLPIGYPTFDESFADYKIHSEDYFVSVPAVRADETGDQYLLLSFLCWKVTATS